MRARPVLALVVTAATAACSHLPSGGLQDTIDAITLATPVTATAPVLAPAPRPAVRVGDTYVFGAASVRRVTSVSRTALTWSTTSGQALRTSRDFFTPVLEQTLPGRRIGSRIDGQPGALWPLSVGKSVTFTETRTTSPAVFNREAQVQLRWNCEVLDTRVSQVPAGDFDTFHVVCKAYRDGFPLPLQTVTWDYAPSLGHYVRRTWYEGGLQRGSQLGAALPGPLATPARLQATLERLQQMQQP
ncbi:MAG: hypothetical protein QUV35_02315 [Hydrogenophaga sp.]|uniref:hypothetical protein n=1 Tax=Hydrogenophaga sp. TaxID=1904254 RepID=UPI0026151003|nr:hypothetical protein [Hydrogenophaga sp.]MDM7941441.1 hypothetical protein [Hydrogenophaga sp.]